MNMCRTFLKEFEFYFKSSVRLYISCGVNLLIFIGTWLSCNGKEYVWKLCKVQGARPPFLLLFILGCIMALSFGALMSVSMKWGCSGNLGLRCVSAYFMSLLWCPLTLIAASCFFSVTVILLAWVHIFMVARAVCRYSLIAKASVVVIALIQSYFMYITLVLAFPR